MAKERRDECPSEHLFANLAQARRIIEDWRDRLFYPSSMGRVSSSRHIGRTFCSTRFRGQEAIEDGKDFARA
jgi:hypothetical protein